MVLLVRIERRIHCYWGSKSMKKFAGSVVAAFFMLSLGAAAAHASAASVDRAVCDLQSMEIQSGGVVSCWAGHGTLQINGTGFSQVRTNAQAGQGGHLLFENEFGCTSLELNSGQAVNLAPSDKLLSITLN
ncbi:hypothetical protein D5S17_06730 [Pseudonocardiaceae bacterium YIM PH 21723]|nr:hypothetical protein D5S17_06730 [Pseudonocardiaceae bacterium YIM PH 21723]